MEDNAVLFQMDAYDRMPMQAARIFAHTHWDESREIEEMDFQPNGDLLFRVENGIRWYAVKRIPAVPLTSLALFQITVAKEG